MDASATPQLDPLRARQVPRRCAACGRPHGIVLRCLPDGRWYDPHDATWRDGRGRRAPWPDVVEYAGTRDRRAVVRLVRLSGEAGSRPRPLCGRCQMLAEVPRNAARARLRALARKALGDLFTGSYEGEDALRALLGRARRPRKP